MAKQKTIYSNNLILLIRIGLVGAVFLCAFLNTPFFEPVKSALAEDLYVAQAAQGNDDGTSCANAKSRAWFNTSGSWSSGVGFISAGDTVHLCGTITERMETQASGSAGSPITLLFETNARMSAAAWNHTGAIYVGHSYIIVDGGTNGLIEATDNGEGLGNQLIATGVVITTASHVEVKNLTISNIYQKVSGSAHANGYGEGIYIGSHASGSYSDISVHDCLIDDAYTGIEMQIDMASVSFSDISVYDNTITRTDNGISGWLSADVSQSFDNINIYGNTITDNYVWDGSSFFAYGIIFYDQGGVTQSPTNSVTDLKIYNNTIGAAAGQAMGTKANGWIYLQGASIATPLIYNNLLLGNSSSYPPLAAGAFINVYESDQAKIFNNTIISQTNLGHGIKQRFSTQSQIKNNIFSQLSIAVYLAFSSSIATDGSDYNDIYTSNANCFYQDGQYTLAQWRSTFGFDTQSITSDPSLDSNYRPDDAADPVVNAGADLSQYFVIDKDSNTRPFSSGWDMGAYEFITAQLPTVTVTATDNSASETGPATGTYTVTRSNTTGSLTVDYAMSGTATNGTDYTNLSGSVVLADGLATAIVTLTPIDDVVADEGQETAILSLSTSANYNRGTPYQATINIADNEVDTTAPVIAQVTAVITPANDTTPNYTFSSTEAGTITFGGSCSSSTTTAIAGSNTVTFNALAQGTYSNCTIRVTDSQGNPSNLLAVDPFTIDTTPPTVTNGGPTGTLATDTTSTTMTVTTSQNATCRYATDADTVFTSMTNNFGTTGGVSHSVNVSGLSAGNSYTFYVRCRDTAGNSTTSDTVITFSVAAAPAPTPAPITIPDTAPSQPSLLDNYIPYIKLNSVSYALDSQSIFYSQSTVLDFLGRKANMAGGQVRIYRKAKKDKKPKLLRRAAIDGAGNWETLVRTKTKKNYYFRFVYHNAAGQKIYTTKYFNTKVRK